MGVASVREASGGVECRHSCFGLIGTGDQGSPVLDALSSMEGSGGRPLLAHRAIVGDRRCTTDGAALADDATRARRFGRLVQPGDRSSASYVVDPAHASVMPPARRAERSRPPPRSRARVPARRLARVFRHRRCESGARRGPGSPIVPHQSRSRPSLARPLFSPDPSPGPRRSARAWGALGRRRFQGTWSGAPNVQGAASPISTAFATALARSPRRSDVRPPSSASIRSSRPRS